MNKILIVIGITAGLCLVSAFLNIILFVVASKRFSPSRIVDFDIMENWNTRRVIQNFVQYRGETASGWEGLTGHF